MKPTCRKLWDGNLLMCSNLNLGPSFKGWESSDVFRFYLGTLLEGQVRTGKLKSAFTYLLLVLQVCNVKPTYR